MSKSPDAFRSIGEVSRLVGVAPHVLRYWESQFPQLAPVKRADGRRYYRPDDVRLAAGLCQVMREEGLSIRGARRLIGVDRGLALRDIGAARLGETLGASPDLHTPAPSPAPVEPPRPPRRAPRPPESLPLFDRIEPAPTPEWLDRLTRTAAGLRLRALNGAPLPDRMRPLRAALADPR